MIWIFHRMCFVTLIEQIKINNGKESRKASKNLEIE